MAADVSHRVGILTIGSNAHDGVLELRPLDSDHISAELQMNGLHARARISTYLWEGFGDFFQDLAEHWNGWTGVREWETYPRELRLRAAMDSAGHVKLVVEFVTASYEPWSIAAPIMLEAGQLASIARDARAFEVAAIEVE